MKARPAAAVKARPAAAMTKCPAAASAALTRHSRTASHCAKSKPRTRQMHRLLDTVARDNLTLMCKDIDQRDNFVLMFITNDGQPIALRDEQGLCPGLPASGAHMDKKVMVDVEYTVAGNDKTYEGDIVSVFFKKYTTRAEYVAHCKRFLIDRNGYATMPRSPPHPLAFL